MEGILLLHPENLRKTFDLKIFVDEDSDTRLSRRCESSRIIIATLLISKLVLRDTKFRGRNIEDIIVQYERFVKPSFDTYILPVSRTCPSLILFTDARTV